MQLDYIIGRMDVEVWVDLGDSMYPVIHNAFICVTDGVFLLQIPTKYFNFIVTNSVSGVNISNQMRFVEQRMRIRKCRCLS